ncbi:hypothetical protein HanOQP8_Chr01g0010271 [Helianthus annuus]|nr:hypothetical protein HanOQP8_Chr01g0010271 [Helianthus annuus]
MLNQAQSNSLVVETYKRWVELESSCHKLQREVANLKGEGDIRSKTKQELASLRSQIDRLKGQVSEAKEVSKSSHASAAIAHEARDKALQELEAFKGKFVDLEKKLAGEVERARDRAVESHNVVVDEAKGMLTRCDSEMVELYVQTSELMLMKQWFLTEGVAWVVKLVQQSPEPVIANLVNSVNAVGANEGIKQGFKAAHDSVRSAEEVPGYDEGAQDALDAAVKAFNELQIFVLGKVADLVDKPLSVIQQRSKLPIVEEDDNVAQV